MRANKNIKNEYYIPQDVLNRIDPKETLLFNLRSEFISTFYKFYPIMAIIIIGMGLWLIIESIPLFGEESFMGEMAPVTLIMGIGVIVLMLFFASPSLFKEFHYLLITDKQIHLHVNTKKEMKKAHYSSDLDTLKAIIYELNKKSNNGNSKNSGKLTFIFNEIYPRRKNKFSLYIPNVVENLKRIESVLFHAGNFNERWINIRNTKNYKLPQRVRAQNKVLILNENGFDYETEVGNYNIPFKQDLQLDYTYKFKEIDKKKVSQTTGMIIIKPSYTSSDIIKFGPIENCIELLEIFYLKLCIWKEKSGYLYSKVQLLKLKDKKVKTIPSVSRLELLPISPLDVEIQKIQNYLEDNENLYLYYSPNLAYKKNIILIIVGISSIFFTIYQFIFFVITETALLSFWFMTLSLIITIFLSLCCCFSSMFLNVKFKLNKSIFCFTDSKLIMKLADRFYNIPYNNIVSVTHHIEGDAYVVEIGLKKPMKVGSIEEEYEILMPIRPKNEEVLEKVKIIRELLIK